MDEQTSLDFKGGEKNIFLKTIAISPGDGGSRL